MLVFDPSAATKQFLVDQLGVGMSPVYIQVRSADQFTNAFKNLTKKEGELKRPLGLRVTDKFGEYWVEGTTAWHKVVAFKQSFCRLDTKREETHRWICCGCIATALCYHTAKAFDIHTKLAAQQDQYIKDLADKMDTVLSGYIRTH